jgi:hypothetical protein
MFVLVSLLRNQFIYLFIYLSRITMVILFLSTYWLISAPPSNRDLRLGVIEEDFVP